MTSPLQIAIIGAGQFGMLHLHTLAHLPGVSLSAIVDPNEERVLPIAKKLHLSYYPSFPHLLKNKATSLDGIIIATRTESHLSLVRQALEAGLYVFVEKPLAGSANEIRQLMCDMGTRCQNVMLDHLCLFHSLTYPLIQKIDQTGFRALHFTRHRPDHIGRHFPEEHPIQLTMIHDLYVAARMVNGEDPVYFHAVDSHNASGRTDMSWATLRWKDGRVATFHCHMGLPDGVPAEGWDQIEVFGESFHSKITTNPAPWTWTDSQIRWPVNLEISEINGLPTGMLSRAQEAFFSVCRGANVPEGCRVEDALQVQEWTDQLLISSRNSAL